MDRSAYLSELRPGADIDYRGTSFDRALLQVVLDALRDPATRHVRFGTARFDRATFQEDAEFQDVTFEGIAHFSNAGFYDNVWFEEATFSGDAVFAGAVFSGRAWFNGATFSADVNFNKAKFSREAWFDEAVVVGRTDFLGSDFSHAVRFDRAAFSGEVMFGDGGTSSPSSANFADRASFREASFSHDASFVGSVFSSDADFTASTFGRNAGFHGAAFSGDAKFRDAVFSLQARFDRAVFSGIADFDSATFSYRSRFDRATFSGNAVFSATTFGAFANFQWAIFSARTRFARATFSALAAFSGAQFEASSHLGPLVCRSRVTLDGAVFEQPVKLEIAAQVVSAERTRWASTAVLHLRYAELDLTDAVFEYPIMIVARQDPFRSFDPRSRRARPTDVPENLLSDREPTVHLVSMNGVDAAHLALQDVDLSACRFTGAVHLDQLRVDGWCTFASAPSGWGKQFPWRWSRRNTLAEEHYWRVRTARNSGQAVARGWARPAHNAPELRPAAVAALYRQLRKSLEDGKNEPDAADFYYGECEMRRHDVTRPWAERALLGSYWALSGYGLRAGRALGWLGGAVVVTVAVLMLWGLPVDDPKPVTTGRQSGQDITLTTDSPDPVNPTGPLHERVTTERFEKSLRIVINSVVFRSSGQDLTTAGTYTEMTSRITEPVLLGLAVLAIRNRVKR
ncbi:pentapeptide repeat-containing protein [Streptomyces griseus]|uniref:pentapeptide repeat-containing protein n=1 Tax=Streptomyces griseus TaxID=1911 RepID=UPI0037AD3A59